MHHAVVIFPFLPERGWIHKTGMPAHAACHLEDVAFFQVAKPERIAWLDDNVHEMFHLRAQRYLIAQVMSSCPIFEGLKFSCHE